MSKQKCVVSFDFGKEVGTKRPNAWPNLMSSYKQHSTVEHTLWGMTCPTYFSVLLRVHKAVAYPGIFFRRGGGHQIQLRTEGREIGDLGAVAP